jgi:hypothetical protein
MSKGILDQCDHNECDSKCGIEKPTRAVFRKYKAGDIIALFPDEEYSRTSPGLISSYMRVGQHSGADYLGVMSETVPAAPKEYESLKRELERIGYMIEPIKRFVRRRK